VAKGKRPLSTKERAGDCADGQQRRHYLATEASWQKKNPGVAFSTVAHQ